MDEASTRRDPNELLESAAWVRRMARTLLGDAHLAEEVTQDALVAAWSQETPHDPGRFRRWLAGATRQLAWRVRDRERERPLRESRAARPESTEGSPSAADRLRLHRRLVDAVLELDDPYRSTLVAKFFDELPLREIARREGVKPEVVRQRLSRGLARLRTRLDAEFEGGRSAWGIALAGLIDAGGLPWRPAWIPEVLSMSAKKVMTVAIALTLAGASVWWTQRDDTNGLSAVANAQTSELEGASINAAADAVSAGGVEESTREEIAPVAEVVVPALSLEVTMTNAAGEPLRGTVFVLDSKRVLASATSDESGSVAFEPVDGAGFLVADAEARPPAVLALAELTGIHRVILEEGHVLSGSILVDGAPLDESIVLRLRSHSDPLAILPEAAIDALRDAKGLADIDEVVTNEEGSFRVDGLRVDWTGGLDLPTTHWYLAAPRGTSIDDEHDNLLIEAPIEGLELETTALPAVRGRVVWADTNASRYRWRASGSTLASTTIRRRRGSSSTRTMKAASRSVCGPAAEPIS